jgi:hypothetical protein
MKGLLCWGLVVIAMGVVNPVDAQQCGMCEDTWQLKPWFNGVDWEMIYVYTHRLGYEEHIVQTFGGDGVHANWTNGRCVEVHGGCTPGGGGGDDPNPELLPDLYAALPADRVHYVQARNVLQVLDCRGLIVAQRPLTDTVAAMLSRFRAV